jgi:hypothetical protein
MVTGQPPSIVSGEAAISRRPGGVSMVIMTTDLDNTGCAMSFQC